MKSPLPNVHEELNTVTHFASLTKEEKDFLSRESIMRAFSRQERIFTEDAPAEGFYLLSAGLAKIFHLTADGREIILHLVRPGATLGESAVFQRGTFPASASALEESRAIFMPSAAVMKLVRQNPSFAEAMLSVLALRIRLLTRKIEAQGGREALARLAAYIAHRMILGKRKEHVRLELSREDLAQMLGTARETLSRAMARLTRQGIVRVKGRDVEVLDAVALEEIAGGTLRSIL